MKTLKIGRGRVRAEMVSRGAELSVTVYRTPHVGSAKFAHQMATKPRVMATGRAMEERVAHQNVSARDRRGPETVKNLLSRHGLRPLTRGDQAKLDALLDEVFSQEVSHAGR